MSLFEAGNVNGFPPAFMILCVLQQSDILADDATSDTERRALVRCMCNAAIMRLGCELITQYY